LDFLLMAPDTPCHETHTLVGSCGAVSRGFNTEPCAALSLTLNLWPTMWSISHTAPGCKAKSFPQQCETGRRLKHTQKRRAARKVENCFNYIVRFRNPLQRNVPFRAHSKHSAVHFGWHAASHVHLTWTCFFCGTRHAFVAGCK